MILFDFSGPRDPVPLAQIEAIIKAKAATAEGMSFMAVDAQIQSNPIGVNDSVLQKALQACRIAAADRALEFGVPGWSVTTQTATAELKLDLVRHHEWFLVKLFLPLDQKQPLSVRSFTPKFD